MAEQTYCTEEQLANRKGATALAEVTGDASGQQVDSDKVTEAIEDIAGRMNGELRKNYPDLPFDETNQYLNGINLQGAWLYLKRDTPRGWSESDREDWKLLMKDINGLSDKDLRTETDEELEAMTEGFFSTDKAVFGRRNGL